MALKCCQGCLGPQRAEEPGKERGESEDFLHLTQSLVESRADLMELSEDNIVPQAFTTTIFISVIVFDYSCDPPDNSVSFH